MAAPKTRNRRKAEQDGGTAGAPARHDCEFVAQDLVMRLDMTMGGDVREVGPAVERIMAVISEMSCAPASHFEIELAVTEALANAVEHGCRHDPGKTVEVCVECDKGRGVLIIVRDPGEGFDPATVPSPLHGQQVYQEGGRGVFLINQLMDEVRYEKGGTEIWMRKR
jgi:serine/threonine-protein kinase RsbW